MEELLAQVNHRLAILPPEVLKDLRCLHLDSRLVQLLHQFRVLLLTLRQLTGLRLKLLVEVDNFAMQARILTGQEVQLISQLIQVNQAVLFGICELGPQAEDLLVQLRDLRVLLPLVEAGIVPTGVPVRLVHAHLILTHITQLICVVSIGIIGGDV